MIYRYEWERLLAEAWAWLAAALTALWSEVLAWPAPGAIDPRFA